MPWKKIKFFADLHPHEAISLVIREHWVVPVSRAFFWVIFLALIVGAGKILPSLFPFFAEPLPAAILAILGLLLIATAVLGLFITWVLYYLNVQVITNERIVDITQKSLLNHQTSELNLDRFQDVTTEVKGPLANFFDFGDVRVQTAGEMENFIFNAIPHPHNVAKLILELYEQTRRGGQV